MLTGACAGRVAAPDCFEHDPGPHVTGWLLLLIAVLAASFIISVGVRIIQIRQDPDPYDEAMVKRIQQGGR